MTIGFTGQDWGGTRRRRRIHDGAMRLPDNGRCGSRTDECRQHADREQSANDSPEMAGILHQGQYIVRALPGGGCAGSSRAYCALTPGLETSRTSSPVSPVLARCATSACDTIPQHTPDPSTTGTRRIW